MRDGQAFWAVHGYADALVFCREKNAAQGRSQGVVERLDRLFQSDDAGFQPRSFDHRLHQKVQLVQLAVSGFEKFSLLFAGHFVVE